MYIHTYRKPIPGSPFLLHTQSLQPMVRARHLGVSKKRGTSRALGFLEGIYKGSIKGLGFRVSEKRGP